MFDVASDSPPVYKQRVSITRSQRELLVDRRRNPVLLACRGNTVDWAWFDGASIASLALLGQLTKAFLERDRQAKGCLRGSV